jgi:uncharacterized membrane protein
MNRAVGNPAPRLPGPGWLALAWPWLAIAVVGLAAAALRSLLIEPSAIAHLCDVAASPGWCAWRQAAVLGFLGYGYGYAALAATLLTLLWKHPLAAWLAAALGLAALQLYCVDAGAFALLLGGLRLIRWQTTLIPPAPPHRRGEHEVQRQP